MRKMLIAALFICVTTIASAQSADEMRKLDFLVGEWSGEAWVQMGPGKPQYVLQNETVRPRLGGRVLLVEGRGLEKLEDGKGGKVVHDALAVISWDAAKKTYRFSTYTADRGDLDTTLDITGENTAVWGMTTPQGGKIRYTIRLTENGEWNEAGEFSRDGEKWMKFFEMTLKKR